FCQIFMWRAPTNICEESHFSFFVYIRQHKGRYDLFGVVNPVLISKSGLQVDYILKRLCEL
ncbi:MAG: hypothetical protein PVF32_17945, partial [Desulfobacterales bacterium]